MTKLELEKIILEEIRIVLVEKKRKGRKKKSKKKSKGSESLHKWFKRDPDGSGPKKSGGWVDCNTCRKDKKTGRRKCKPCGRKKGEKRSKYPACRASVSLCGKRGKWGKKSKRGKKG